MIPQSIIESAATDGVRLTLKPNDGLLASGNPEAIDKWRSP